MSSTTIALIAVLALGWFFAVTFGTWAYFANEPQAGRLGDNNKN
ncbi:MAG: endonuclease [Cyanophyceae cyanobacterium]